MILSCYPNKLNDTGIFVHEPQTPVPREANWIFPYESFRIRVEILIDFLSINHELQLQVINYNSNEVNLEDLTQEEFTQFYFHFCNSEQGIYVDRLTLPLRLRRRGIGTYCINWLKDFANDFRFKYIILGSLVEARTFWIKMGFRLLTNGELSSFPGYQGRYNR
ncbi:hypothetical protein [Desulfosporosinus sp. FKA]|uniref:hypothetical protein n=1 Tax=Desulfosporosinus sp. FKA TaxID=1969834 RepID=UPI000B4A2B15|nr:hypothetical protein [Desulfosporosinus sp. FKA]